MRLVWAEADKIKLEKDKQKAIDQTNRINAIAATVQSTLNAINAVAAAINAVKSGSTVPFPANLAAIAAGLAAVIAAVVSAKSIKLKTGGIIDGPSHEDGGVRGTGRFSNIEVEGGEGVLNKRATANNSDVFHTLNQFGANTKFALQPITRFADGGILPTLNTTGITSRAEEQNNLIRSELQNYAEAMLQLSERTIVVVPSEVVKEQARTATIQESALS